MTKQTVNIVHTLTKYFIFVFFGFFLYFHLQVHHTENVKGTIYDKTKNTYQLSADEPERVYANYIMAIHPDDDDIYKDFEVGVDYPLWAKCKVGQHVTFEKDSSKVLRNVNGLYTTLPILFLFFTLSSIIIWRVTLKD